MKSGRYFWLISLTLILIVAGYASVLAYLLWQSIAPSEQQIVKTLFKPEYMFILFCPTGLLLFLFLSEIFKSWIRPLGKLSEEMLLIQSANPSHRIDITGSKTVRNIADLINKWADTYEELSVNVREKIKKAGKQIEDEKNILAAFISELSEGVLICRNDGRILLFNKTVKEFLSEGSATNDKTTGYIGLGRSVFALMDKNIVVHALDTIHSKLTQHDENCVATFVIIGKNRRQIKVEAVPIIDAHREMTGFIFLMTDITSQLIEDKKAEIMLQNLTKEIRASLGGIRAAVETIIDFPDMAPDQREVFNNIIHKEAKSLGDTIDLNQKEYLAHVHSKWPLVHMHAGDFARSFKSKAEEKLNIHIDLQEYSGDLWIKADSYSLTTAFLFLAARIRETKKISQMALKLFVEGSFVHIDLTWQGDAIKIDTIKKWGDMILMVENEGLPLTLDEVAGHHTGEILPSTAPEMPEHASLKLLLPAVETSKSQPVAHGLSSSIIPDQRPEFYDFDLFEQQAQSEELIHAPLKELTYTVFDTETTGLYPSGGDEIISIGAVRIVNMKPLNDDIFDQLIDPKRSVPESSIKIHGIEPEMLEGQPDIEITLPQFYTYTEDTVLVGHNVAFDMAMLKAKEQATGITFTHPVLDTLLLSTVVNPEQESHSIEAITRRLGISVIGRHTAVGDAITTAEMFIKMIHLLAEMEIHTLGDAIEASKKSYYARLTY